MAIREDPIAANARQLADVQPARPRIVFLHFSAPPIVGGVEAVIAEQVRLFSSAGYETLIVAGRQAEQTPAALGPVAVIPAIDSENPEYLKLQDHLIAGIVSPDFLALQAAIQDALLGALRPGDIVIAHNTMTTHFNLALTHAIHSLVVAGHFPRLIIWCHDLSRHVNPERDVPQYHGRPWDLLRTRLPGAIYVAVSKARQRTLAHILDCPPELIRVIPNGVDAVQLLALSSMGRHLADTYALLQADLVILMPVRITRLKNVEFALRVVHALKAAGLRVRLVVTGPPDPHVPEIAHYYAELVGLRNELSLEDEAHFVYEGTRQHPSPLVLDAPIVAELYRIADLILMPSIREGFGMPILEAAFVGRTVFATDIPIVQELPGFQYLISRDETPEAVAKRMIDWAESDGAHKLRRVARQEFTWGHVFTQRVLPLIESLDASRRGAVA